jgi:autotransporter-associated beta strand protein
MITPKSLNPQKTRPSMKSRRFLFPVIPSRSAAVSCLATASLVICYSFQTAAAADGSWTANANGLWSTPANWADGTVAGGVGSTATFDINITADRTIDLTGSVTVGNILFRDTALGSQAYILGGTAGTLTLNDGANKPTLSVYPRSGDLIVARVDRPIAGNNGFELLAPGGGASIALNAANTFSGSVIIGSGADSVMLRTDNNAALGTADALTTAVSSSDPSVTGMTNFTEIRSGGTLSLNGSRNLGNEFIKVQGAGWDGNGAIVNNAAADAQSAIRQMQLVGDTTLGGSRRWDILGPSAGAGRLFQDGFTLTKAGGNTIFIKDTQVIGGGDIVIDQGSLGLQATTSMGGTGTINVNTGTSLAFWALTGSVTRAVSMNGGSLGDGNSTANSTLASNIALTVSNTNITKAGTTQELILSGVLSGSGNGITKLGTGTLTLSNPDNTFDGVVAISAGTLNLGATGQLDGLNSVDIASGAVFNTGVAGHTVGTGKVLTVGRIGIAAADIIGNISLASGANLEIGTSLRNAGISVERTASVNGNLALNGGAAYFDLGATPGSAGDLVAVTGDLSLAGTNTLQISPTSGGLAAGNYTLFSYNGALTGDASNLVLAGFPAGTRQTFTPSTTTVANAVTLDVTGDAASLVWKGDGSGNVWDLSATNNWDKGGVPDTFFNLDNVTFDGSGSTSPAVSLVGTLAAGVVTVNSATDYVFVGTGKLSGSAALLKQNSGKLTISGTGHDFFGPVNLDGGTVSVTAINNVGAAGSLGAGSTINFNGGTLEVTGTTVSNRLLAAGASGGTLSVAAGGDLTHTGAAPTGALAVDVANGGTLRVGDGGTIGDLGTAAIQTNASGKVQWYRTNTTVVAVASPLSGAGIAEFKGNGVSLESQYALGGNNSAFSGTFVLDQSRVAVDSATDLGTAAVEVKNGGGLYVSYSAAPLTNNVSISGNGWQETAGFLGAIRLQGANMGGTVTLTGDARISAHGSTGTLSGVIAESGGACGLELHNANTGANSTITLSNTSSRTGANTITGLVAVVRDSSALGSGDITVQSNGTAARITRLDLQGVTLSNNLILASNAQTNFRGVLNASGGSATLTDPVVRSTVNGEVLITAAAGNGGHIAAEPNTTAVLRLNGPIKIPDGSGLIPNIRVGTVELGDTSGAGNLTILQQGEGIARLVADNGMQAGIEFRMAVSNPGTFDLNGYDQSLGQLKRWSNFAATVTNSSADASTLTIQSTADHTFSGVIENGSGGGTVALVKSGSHTLTLSGINSYTGDTTVNGGGLNVTGALGASNLNVASVSTLTGDGSIAGNVTLAGILKPGQGGTTDRSLTVAGNMTTIAGSQMVFQMDAENAHDQLVMAGGTVDVANANLLLQINDTSITPLASLEAATFVASPGTYSGLASWFKIIDGTTTGVFDNALELDSSELAYHGLSGTHYKYFDGSSSWLIVNGSTYVVAIPEPATGLLAIASAAGVLLRRRRPQEPLS